MTALNINTHPVHLSLDAGATAEPLFTGAMDWYAAYGQRHASDGKEGRLVAMHTFNQSWREWEVHPHGSEVVLCTAGTITLHQEQADGHVTQVKLEAGEYAINPPGVWHTADVENSATVLFITAGLGTEHRPR